MTDGLVQWVMTGGILVISGFSIATYRYVGKIKDEDEKKRSRIYERLDEVKEVISEKFVHKDMCEVLHKQVSSDLTEIKTDLKLLLRKNGFEND